MLDRPHTTKRLDKAMCNVTASICYGTCDLDL